LTKEDIWIILATLIGGLITLYVLLGGGLSELFNPIALAGAGLVLGLTFKKYKFQVEIFRTIMMLLSFLVIASALHTLELLGFTLPPALSQMGQIGAQFRAPVLVWAFLIYYFTGKKWYAWLGALTVLLIAGDQIIQGIIPIILGIVVFGLATYLLFTIGVSPDLIGTVLKWGTAILFLQWGLEMMIPLFRFGLPEWLLLFGQLVNFQAPIALICGGYHLLVATIRGDREKVALASFAIYGLVTYGVAGLTFLWQVLMASVALWLLLEMGGS